MLFAAGLPRVFATHPSIEERLKALDPAFRTSELPALAAAAARDAQRQRAADASRMPASRDDAGACAPAPDRSVRGCQRRAASPRRPAPSPTNRCATPQQRARRDSGRPARLRRLRRSRARADAGGAGQQGSGGARRSNAASSTNAYGAEFTAQVLAQQALADSLRAGVAPAGRAAAVPGAAPALARANARSCATWSTRSGARRRAHRRVRVLPDAAAGLESVRRARGRAAARQRLAAAGDRRHPRAVLRARGAGHREDAQRGARLRGRHLGGAAAAPAGVSRHRAAGPRRSSDALARLVHLRPFAKKVLIEGMVRCIAHDRSSSVEEGELLRTVCAVLHCPLPPILAPAGLAAGS